MRIGIYNLHISTRGGGEKRSLVLADHLSRNNQVFLIVPTRFDVPALERYFTVDLSRVTIVPLDETYSFASRVLALRRAVEVASDPFFKFLTLRRINRLKLDLFINNSHFSDLGCLAPAGIYMCMFPHEIFMPQPGRAALRAAVGSSLAFANRRIFRPGLRPIDTYDVVTANSNYTREWIEKRWQRDAVVVYSACDLLQLSARKEKIILHVGRINLSKRQNVLLDTFKRMDDLHRDGWELHFAGTTSQRPECSEYAARLKEEARGYPVHFHFDIAMDGLSDLYRKASLYWHATGYGFASDPAKQEHFGMTTVEAMSAGAVPIVINSGGQREIVQHEVNGFCWDHTDELAHYTRVLVDDENLREKLAERASASTQRFDRSAFLDKMDQILSQLTRPRAQEDRLSTAAQSIIY